MALSRAGMAARPLLRNFLRNHTHAFSSGAVQAMNPKRVLARPTETMMKNNFSVAISSQIGSCMPLSMMRFGTLIRHIDLRPGQGLKLVCTSGTVAKILTDPGLSSRGCEIKLPSGEKKWIDKICRGIIGQMSNAEQGKNKLQKVGQSRWLGINPMVYRSSHSDSSLKTLALLRNFSTAAERSNFFKPGELNDEHYVDYKQNLNGFYNDEMQMNHRQGGNRNVRVNNGHFQGNPDGFFDGNINGNGFYQQNPAGVYGKTVVNVKQRDQVGKYGNFDNNSSSFSAFKNGFLQNHNGLNGSMSACTGDGQRNEFQQSPVRENGNFGQSGFQNMQKNSSEFHGRPGGNNLNFIDGHPRESQYHHGPVGQRANFGNAGSFAAQKNVNSSSSRNPIDVPTSGYSGGNGVAQHNAVNYNVRSTGVSEQNSGNYYAGRPANFQNMQGWPNSNNVGIRQQTIDLGSQNNGDLVGGDGHLVLKGTIQELDDFFKVGNLEEAVKVLALLVEQGVMVDLPRYLALMKACGENKSLEEARAIHQHLIRTMPNLELSTCNRILEMYSACGSMEDAFRVFDMMQRNLTSWDVMITGLAKNGHGEAAIDLFTEFKELGLKPDGQMYLGVFLACKALFDISEGILHFEAMSKDYGVVPSMEHYVGVVEMLGSAGYLDEALEFIEKMPIQPGVEVWEKLMNLSRIHGNMELGDRCAELVELLDPSLLNEQSRAGLIPLRASDFAKEKDKKKEGGQNPLEIRSRVHEYRAGDRSDPDHEKLYALLWGLKHQMKESGYVPELKGVLHDIDPESKEEALIGHSERLAVARGFLSTPARQPMRVIKNLRICVDCHNAMKIISKLVGRELIMRDAKRFHHFKDGICSCRDYW